MPNKEQQYFPPEAQEILYQEFSQAALEAANYFTIFTVAYLVRTTYPKISKAAFLTVLDIAARAITDLEEDNLLVRLQDHAPFRYGNPDDPAVQELNRLASDSTNDEIVVEKPEEVSESATVGMLNDQTPDTDARSFFLDDDFSPPAPEETQPVTYDLAEREEDDDLELSEADNPENLEFFVATPNTVPQFQPDWSLPLFPESDHITSPIEDTATGSFYR